MGPGRKREERYSCTDWRGHPYMARTSGRYRGHRQGPYCNVFHYQKPTLNGLLQPYQREGIVILEGTHDRAGSRRRRGTTPTASRPDWIF